ncbi:Flagellar secretion chaperone FliS [Methylophilaceae bacterium]|nr:Flagellar secretion chaperone FliS [Methylophilaceae bacterium]
MFGSISRGVTEYKRINLETGIVDANPQRLIVMLYEGAIEACQLGLMHMRQNNIVQKGESLSKAIMIVESGLRLSLDRNAGGEIAESLDALYGYMSNRLYLGHLQNNPDYILEVIKHLVELKSAWEAISNLQSGPAQASAVTQA